MTLTRGDLDEIADELAAAVDAGAAEAFRPRYNVAPTDRHPLVRARGEGPGDAGKRVLELGRWGFARAAAAGKAAPLINARAETVPFKSTFREAYVHRRCVVPADGFFEWQKTPAGRRPFWFHRPDGRLLLLAGLYEEVPGPPGGRPERRFLVLTTAPNALVEKVHDRMPAILEPADARAWLAAPAQSLLRPAPADALVATPVSDRVNSVKNDDPACLTPRPDGPQSGDQLGLFRPV